MDHRVEGPADTQAHDPERARSRSAHGHGEPAPGSRCGVTKFVGYSWSGERTVPAMRDQVDAALAGALQTGWEGLLQEQRAFLDDFWEGADIEIDGDAELQQAVRFALFHTVQAGGAGRAAPDPGEGTNRVRAMTATPSGTPRRSCCPCSCSRTRAAGRSRTLCAGDTVRSTWRASARASLGLRGAAFPWRTIHGEECSGYWPAGAAAFHINAAIADAVERYLLRHRGRGVRARSGGRAARRDRAAVALARPPRRRGPVPDRRGHRTRRVQRDRRQQRLHEPDGRAEPASRGRRDRAPPGTGPAPRGRRRGGGELARRGRGDLHPLRRGARRSPAGRGVHQHQEWDFDSTPPEHYPLLLHYPYFDLYRKQVVKQADLVMALFYAGEYFTPEEKPRDFAFYERLTVRDSSLSACIQAAVARRGGSPRARLRLLRRSRPARPRRPPAQHPRRGAHRLARRGLYRRDRGLRRSAGRWREAQLRPPPPAGADPPGVQPPRPQTTRLRIEVEHRPKPPTPC